MDCDLPHLDTDLGPSRACCRMQLRAATKQTDANFVGVIRKTVQSFKVVTTDSIGTCSSALYSLLFPKAAAKGSFEKSLVIKDCL